MGYDRGDSFPFNFLNQMDFHLVQKIDRKRVTTIISHSIWKEIEYEFSQCRQYGLFYIRDLIISSNFVQVHWIKNAYSKKSEGLPWGLITHCATCGSISLNLISHNVWECGRRTRIPFTGQRVGEFHYISHNVWECGRRTRIPFTGQRVGVFHYISHNVSECGRMIRIIFTKQRVGIFNFITFPTMCRSMGGWPESYSRRNVWEYLI